MHGQSFEELLAAECRKLWGWPIIYQGGMALWARGFPGHGPPYPSTMCVLGFPVSDGWQIFTRFSVALQEFSNVHNSHSKEMLPCEFPHNPACLGFDTLEGHQRR